MKLSRYILYTIAALTVASCSSEHDSPAVEEFGPGAYVRVNIVMPTAARSNPSGGETGDGEEAGSANENNIENLNLFFYRSSDGPDAPDDTPVNFAVYVDDGMMHEADGSVSKIVSLGEYMPSTADRILVSANTGDLTSLKTLGDVRDHIVDSPWRAAEHTPDYTAFTMANASAFDGMLRFTDDKGDLDGSRGRPFGVSVTLERTAARIDLWLDNSTVPADKSRLEYTVSNNDRVALENIAVINSMAQGTYLLKRVTKSMTDDFACFDDLSVCGDERMNADGHTLNYVVEPHTAAKDGDTDEATLVDWYGDSRADYMEQNYASVFGSGTSLASYLPYSFVRSDGSGKRAITLAYTNENTQHINFHKAIYTTGLLLRTTYVPAKVYADAAATVVADFKAGDSFYRYRPAILRDAAPTALYFADRQAAEDYRTAHPEDNATIADYPQGRCYYHLWIRHANVENDGVHQCIPMEYGIVRNNVYCLRLNFNGPGTPAPTLRDPENVKAEIYVRKWNLRKQDPIIM